MARSRLGFSFMCVVLVGCGGVPAGADGSTSDGAAADAPAATDAPASSDGPGGTDGAAGSDASTGDDAMSTPDPRCTTTMPVAGAVCSEQGLRCDYASTRTPCRIERFECDAGRWRQREACF